MWSTQLKSHLARIGGHCPSKGGDKIFFYISRDSVTEILSPYITKVVARTTELNNQNMYVLQIRANVVTIWDSFVITNWGSYYKLGQSLSQKRSGFITIWGKIYCKLGQVLQIRAVIINWGITYTMKMDLSAFLSL